MDLLKVRDGRKTVPTCPKCGCRVAELQGGGFFHFLSNDTSAVRDARGCKCVYIDAIWNKEGKIVYI